MLTIVPLSEENRMHFNQADARFLAGDRVQLHVNRKGFSTEYIPLQAAEWRSVKPFAANASRLLINPNAACYLAYVDGQPAGQCIFRAGAHRLCDLLDIRTDIRYRRQGVGTALLGACVTWAESAGCAGIRAEATDWQSVAAQFFEGCGFTLGGVDRLLHAGQPDQAVLLPAMRESVLMFYKFLK